MMDLVTSSLTLKVCMIHQHPNSSSSTKEKGFILNYHEKLSIKVDGGR